MICNLFSDKKYSTSHPLIYSSDKIREQLDSENLFMEYILISIDIY